MAVLSDNDIVHELGKDVVIEPFFRDQVGPNSYDTTLGAFYWTRQENAFSDSAPFNPLNAEHVKRFWGVEAGPRRAETVSLEHDAKRFGVMVGDEVIVIPANQLILAHTSEFIGGRGRVTTMMKARSTIGRGGLTICSCAGLGDVGFFNRYVYEIHNRNPVPVVLKVGSRIGQIMFMRTGQVLVPYEKRGQYQHTANITELIETWTPFDMIPMYRQKEKTGEVKS